MTEQDPKQNLGKIALEQRAVPASGAFREEVAQGVGGKHAGADGDNLTNLPTLELESVGIELSVLDLIPREIAKEHGLLPIAANGDGMVIAFTGSPSDRIIDELEFVTGKRIMPHRADASALSDLIDILYDYRARGDAFYFGPQCDEASRRRLSDSTAPKSRPFSGFDARRPSDLASAPKQDSHAPFSEIADEVSSVSELPYSSIPAGADHKIALVVEDEPDIRKLIAKALTSVGWIVIEAKDGQEALARLKATKPQLIILDAMLPHVHGFEIAQRVKASQRYKDIPIVMVSAVYRGWGMAADLRERCGVEAYVEKPFTISDLLKTVEEAISGTGSVQQESDAPATTQILAAASAAFLAGNEAEAIKILEGGVKQEPLAYRLHYQLGLMYGRANKLYEAIGVLEKASKLNPTHYSGAKNLAILYQRTGFRRKALETWQRALNLAPDDATREKIVAQVVQLSTTSEATET